MGVGDLRWLLPLAVGGVGIVIMLVAIIRGAKGWTASLALVACLALLGAGVFNKISFSPKEGLLIETVQTGAQALVDLKAAVASNSSAISELTKQIQTLAGASRDSAANDLNNKTWQAIINSANDLSAKNLQNNLLLDKVTKSNDLLMRNLGELNAAQ